MKSDRRFSWTMWTVLAICGLACVVYLRFAIIEPGRDWDQSDLAINYSAAMVLRAGGSIYDNHALANAHAKYIGEPGLLYQALFLTYNNPPTTAVLMSPLTLLPFSAARWALVAINNTLYLLAIILLLRELSAPPVAVIVCWLLGVLGFYFPIRQSFGLGQINGVLVAALAVAMIAAVRGRDELAGVFIILAATIKISPALMLGYFIAQRRWRVWRGAIVMSIVVVMLTVIATGGETVRYFVATILPEVGRGSAAYPNQSLLGALYRFFVPMSAIQTSGAIGDYPLPRLLWLGSSIGLAAVTLWVTARARLDAKSNQAVALSGFIGLGVLTGSVAWDHYALWLVVPTIALIVNWFQDRWLIGSIFWPLLGVAVIAINLPVPIQAGLHSSLGAIGTSLTTWGTLVLWGLTGWRVWRLPAR